MRKILFFLTLVVSVFTTNAQSILNVKVIDEEKLNMPGASVRLAPGNRQVISNQIGLAVFQGLKAGRYTLSIEYIGYQKIDRQIDIKDGVNDIIEQERHRGVTVVMATHELSDAERATSVMLLAQRVVAFGPPAEALRDDHLRECFGFTQPH